MIEVALFPIPNVVAFPGTTLPLHVFEPRYRQLVNDCVRDGRMLGVSHVIKTIREAPRRQTLEQALGTNQATYKPREVFSAGPCEIAETTEDGRMFVQVDVVRRLTLVEELQSLPYRIVTSTPLEDIEKPDAESDDRQLQNKINRRLLELAESGDPGLRAALEDPDWVALAPDRFSFSVFRYLRFDPDTMQAVLEMQSAAQRLETIWDLVRGR